MSETSDTGQTPKRIGWYAYVQLILSSLAMLLLILRILNGSENFGLRISVMVFGFFVLPALLIGNVALIKFGDKQSRVDRTSTALIGVGTAIILVFFVLALTT